jgi:hypothetical protein
MTEVDRNGIFKKEQFIFYLMTNVFYYRTHANQQLGAFFFTEKNKFKTFNVFLNYIFN